MPRFKWLVWNFSLVQVLSLPASPEEMGLIRQAWNLLVGPMGSCIYIQSTSDSLFAELWGWRQIWGCFPKHGGHYFKTSACRRWAHVLVRCSALAVPFVCTAVSLVTVHRGLQDSRSCRTRKRWGNLASRQVRNHLRIHNSHWCTRRSLFWCWIWWRQFLFGFPEESARRYRIDDSKMQARQSRSIQQAVVETEDAVSWKEQCCVDIPHCDIGHLSTEHPCLAYCHINRPFCSVTCIYIHINFQEW